MNASLIIFSLLLLADFFLSFSILFVFVIIFTVSLFKFSGDHAQFFANFFGSSHQKLFIIMILLRQGNIMCILSLIFGCCNFILFSLLGDKTFIILKIYLLYSSLGCQQVWTTMKKKKKKERKLFFCVSACEFYWKDLQFKIISTPHPLNYPAPSFSVYLVENTCSHEVLLESLCLLLSLPEDFFLWIVS